MNSDLCYGGDGDGDGAGAGCSDMSGVAVAEGLECGEDASAGAFSFNEDGACINEFRESLAGVGDGVGAGEVACSCAGVDCGFSALLQGARRAPAAQKCPSVRFSLAPLSRRLLESAVHHYPGLAAGNNVVPLTCNM